MERRSNHGTDVPVKKVMISVREDVLADTKADSRKRGWTYSFYVQKALKEFLNSGEDAEIRESIAELHERIEILEKKFNP